MFVFPFMLVAALWACIGFPFGASKADVVDLTAATATLRQLRTDSVGLLAPILTPASADTADIGSEFISGLENETEPSAAFIQSDEVSLQNLRNESEGETPGPPEPPPSTMTTVSTCTSGSCMPEVQEEPSPSETSTMDSTDKDQEDAARREKISAAPELEKVRLNVGPGANLNAESDEHHPTAQKLTAMPKARGEHHFHFMKAPSEIKAPAAPDILVAIRSEAEPDGELKPAAQMEAYNFNQGTLPANSSEIVFEMGRDVVDFDLEVRHRLDESVEPDAESAHSEMQPATAPDAIHPQHSSSPTEQVMPQSRAEEDLEQESL